MNNKLNNMLNDFFKDSGDLSMEEANAKLQEFMQKYNNGEIEYENTPLDDAYEILEKAKNAKSVSKARKLAREAYAKSNECLDAKLFEARLEKSTIKRDKIVDEALEFEKQRLTKEKYFAKENIGSFYAIFETRPYIRGLYIKAHQLIDDGKIKKAAKLCKEILRLNKNDNTGARFLLMAIYAYFEDENSMKKLYKAYPAEILEMLLPFLILYYKEENYKKAKEYLNKIDKENPYFIKFLKGTIDLDKSEKQMENSFRIGGASEVLMYFEDYSFLTNTVPNICDFVVENS